MLRRIVFALFGLILLALVIGAATAYWLFSGDGVRLALERQASAWLQQPVRIGSATAQMLPRVAIHLNDVRVGDPVRLTLAEVDVSSDLRALLARRIEDADVRVSHSRVDMPLPFDMPATSRGAATAAGASMQLVSVRTIALRDVALVSRGRSVTISADASLRGSELTVNSFTASSGGTTLQGSGLVALQPRVDARLRIGGDRVDVDELIALANAFAESPARAGGRPPMRIAARLSAARATAAGVEMGNFAAQLQVEGSDVGLSPLTFQVFGGRYQGALDLRIGNTMSATLQARVADVDVAQLAAFGGSAGAATGRLAGAGTFSGRGADIAAVLGSARGSGTATMTNGTIQQLNLVRTVVLFFGRPAADASPASDHFDRLDVEWSLGNGVVRADALALHSADADIVGSGTLALDSKVLAGRADVSLSEALSAQAGTDLYRYTREGNRVVLPATIGGTLGAPHLGIDAAAALRRGLRNELEKRLEGLLDRFGRAP